MILHQVTLQLNGPNFLALSLCHDVTGAVYTLRNDSRNVTFETTVVPKSLSTSYLTFKYNMPNTQARTLNVSAECTSPSQLIQIGMGRTVFKLSSDLSSPGIDFVSQCLELSYYIRQAEREYGFTCDYFKVLFKGYAAGAHPIVVKEIAFRAEDAVVSGECGKSYTFPLQT